MEYFRSDGYWSPSGEPSNAVGGVLEYSEKGLELKLLGKFRDGWGAAGETYPEIRGVLLDNRFGRHAVLYDGFRRSFLIGSGGVASETIYANRGSIGDDYLTDDLSNLESVEVAVSYLNDWSGRTGIHVDFRSEDFSTVINYRKPAPERYWFRQSELTLGSSFSTSADKHRASIGDEVRFVIGSLRGLSPDEILSRRVRPLQDLLSFATDTPNEIEKVRFLGSPLDEQDRIRKRYNWFHDSIFRLENKKSVLSRDEMLFTLTDAKSAGIDVFNRWSEFTEKNAAFCTLYFALQYAPPRFLDEKLDRLVACFTALSASLHGVSERTSEFHSIMYEATDRLYSGDDRSLILPQLPSQAELEMPLSMLGYLDRNRETMRMIIGDDFRAFVKSLLESLRFSIRRQGSECSSLLGPEDLLYAMDKLGFLIKILVLQDLGFSDEQVKSLLGRNKAYSSLKSHQSVRTQ
jgi:hypothetical protein